MMQEYIHTFKCLDTVITTIELRFIEGILYGIDAYSGEVGFSIRFSEDSVEVSPSLGMLVLTHVLAKDGAKDAVDRLLDNLSDVLKMSVCEEFGEAYEV